MPMQPYANAESGILRYEIGERSITIQFKDGGTYLYDQSAPGWSHVERMKLRARAGKGLASYISKNVGANYAAKLG